MNANSPVHPQAGATFVRCVGCNSSSGLYWRGWRAYRIDDREADEPTALAFYCPTCAGHEFGA